MANKQRDIMAEIQATLAKNPTADVTGLVKERGAKLMADPKLQEQFGASQKELESRFLPPTPTAPQPAPEQNIEQIRGDLLRIDEQQKLAEVARGTEQQEQAVRERGEAIAPKFKELRSAANVSTQLGQKRLKDLFAATGAQAGTGAARQIAAEQGLQAKRGALRVQEAKEEAQVAKDLSDIKSERAFLEQQIRSGTASALVSQQLADLEAKQAQAVKDAEIRSEREFTLMRDEMAQMNKESLALLDNQLRQENTILDAQIQEARDNLQFEQAQVLEAQKSQNNIKLQAMRDANAMARIEAGKEVTPDEQRLIDLDIQEAELRNRKLERDLEEIASDPVVETIPNDILNTLNDTFITQDITTGENIVDNDKMWDAVVNLYLSGNLKKQQADRLEAMYGLTEPPNYVYQGGR